MSRAVSIVIPSLAGLDSLRALMPGLVAELERRSSEHDVQDEIIVVDDSGEDVLRPWFSKEYPAVHGVVHKMSRGLGRAMLSGAMVAKQDHVLFLTPDARVREGFLDPLVDCLEDGDVFAAAPRQVAPDGSRQPFVQLRLVEGRLREIVRINDGEEEPAQDGLRPLPTVPRGAFVMRRKEFVDGRGLDEMFAPFDGDPLDLGLAAWRRGRRVVEVAASVVETDAPHAANDDGDESTPDLRRAAIEKNRLLAAWKHLDDPDLASEHLSSLWRLVVDAGVDEWEEELRWLVLALEQLEDVARGRAAAPGWSRDLGQAVRESSATE